MRSNRPNAQSGYIFNIQRYSLHDGPGIRTVVFLKGCPLRCRWCSNPESQQRFPELAYNNSKCIGCQACFLCKEACAYGAIKQNAAGAIEIDRSLCGNCLECTAPCPSKALHTFGQLMSVPEIIKAVEADSLFYTRSGGGLTISGGEPLMQADFVTEIIKEAKKRRINATIETCGYAAWADLKRVGENLKTIIYDIKSLNADKHKRFTGVTNELICDNLIRLRREFPDLHILVRTPVIPGFNDTKTDIKAILSFLKHLPNTSYELLPYHRLGQQKYQYLGRSYPMKDVQLDEQIIKDISSYQNSLAEIQI